MEPLPDSGPADGITARSSVSANQAILKLLQRKSSPNTTGTVLLKANMKGTDDNDTTIVKTLLTFTCFGKLPSELRQRIWQWSLPREREILLYNKKGYDSKEEWDDSEEEGDDSEEGRDDGKEDREERPPNPITLRVCRESRAESTRFYKPFRAHIGVLYLDTSIDCFRYNMALELRNPSHLFYENQELWPKVRTVSLQASDFLPADPRRFSHLIDGIDPSLLTKLSIDNCLHRFSLCHITSFSRRFIISATQQEVERFIWSPPEPDMSQTRVVFAKISSSILQLGNEGCTICQTSVAQQIRQDGSCAPSFEFRLNCYFWGALFDRGPHKYSVEESSVLEMAVKWS